MRLEKLKFAALVLAASVGTGAFAATIRYAADSVAGEIFDGGGHAISVTVETPSDAVVEYSESAEGPWSASLGYVDVCTAKPMYFRITADGYDTVIGSQTVTILPKDIAEATVWAEQDGEFVYDGMEKRPTPQAEDTAALITADDYAVAYEDNVNAGTARVVFTGRRNYTGTAVYEFEILRAENEWTTQPAVADWTYGQSASEPVSAAKSGTATVVWSTGEKPTLPGSYTATFIVPESRNYNELTATVPFTIHAATIRYVADGNPQNSVYCNRGYGIEVNVSVPSAGATVSYATSEEGPWLAQPVVYTNACSARPVWFRIEAEGYATVTDSRPVTILPRDIAEATVWAEQDGEYVYDGTEKRPTPQAEDTAALITADDYDVAYEDNVNAGTARVVFTGKRNYTGTAVYEFEILPRPMVDGGGEPGSGNVPEGGLSKFDASFLYDGEEHTIKTNALAAAFAESVGADAIFAFAAGGNGSVTPAEDSAWSASAPALTNAGELVVWYRVSKANYEDFTRAARVTVRPRTVGLTSGDGTWTYDGAAHSNVTVTVSGDGFVSGDGATFSGFAEITEEGSRPNSFGYALDAGTLAANYAITTRFGTLTIEPSPAKAVVLDALGGRIGSAAVLTQSFTRVYGDLPAAVRTGYRLVGWTLGVTNGAPVATAGVALLADADHTLFARWEVDPAIEPDAEDLFAWETTDGGAVRILGFRDTARRIATVVIPDTIDGLPVAEIGRGAFANATNGMAEVTLPVFCTTVGFRAFSGIRTLTRVMFTPVRDWVNPSHAAEQSIGGYAFAATGLSSVRLPATVAALGDYAFADCRSLTEMTVLGRPSVGKRPFRRAGIDAAERPVVRLDPALEGDEAYRAAILQDVTDVVVRTDAVVESLALNGLSVGAGVARIAVTVGRAADWGEVDVSALCVEYRANLGDAPTVLVPRSVGCGADGSLVLEVDVPEGPGGFFRVRTAK